MKKFLLTALLAAATIGLSSAEVKVTVTPLGEHPAASPSKSVSTADIIVNENFEGFETGSPEEPSYDDALAMAWTNTNIDPELLHGEQWTGHKVYSAGGVCALKTINPMDAASIETPVGDYSGSIKISFLAKYTLCEWEDEDGKKWHFTGSGISVGLYDMYDSSANFDVTDEDGNETLGGHLLCDVRLYDNQGWCQIEIECDNYTANNNAQVVFFCNDAVLLDDIKITSSVDKFIAAPIINGVTDVTETSFTIDFQKVRKSYNYYIYLYTLDGYDEETGDPLYVPVFDKDMMADINEYFGGVDAYLEAQEYDKRHPEESPYMYLDIVKQVEKEEPRVYTYANLDPNIDYYYAVRAHYVHTFSPLKLYPMTKIAAPVVAEAKNIKADSFTAAWNPIAKADSYRVNLYGVNKATEDTDDFIIFEENFANTSLYTDSDNINDPTGFDEESGLSLDDLTDNPGWDTPTYQISYVQDKLGLSGYGYYLASPDIYVAGSDKVKIRLSLESPEPDVTFGLKFAGVRYEGTFSGNVFEDEFELPTNGEKVTQLWLSAPTEGSMFIDYVILSQSLKAGSYTYTWLGTQDAGAETSYDFSGLDTERFDMYGYTAQAVRGEGEDAEVSLQSERMVVDLKNGTSVDVEITPAANVEEVARYTIDGRQIARPEKGLNIVKYSDGSVRKVYVK